MKAIVRHAYHTAEGNVMDVQGFIDLFADDGVINASQKSYRGEQLRSRRSQGTPSGSRHGERRRELSIRGTFTGAVRVASRRHPADQSQA